MINDCISSIDITTNNRDIISVYSNDFANFYIANLDDDGEEINYYESENNSLFANFFMIKLLNNKDGDTAFILDRLLRRKDILKISVFFKNGKHQEFDLPNAKIIKDGSLFNRYEETFLEENDLCILITDKQIKYKKNLFC